MLENKNSADRIAHHRFIIYDIRSFHLSSPYSPLTRWSWIGTFPDKVPLNNKVKFELFYTLMHEIFLPSRLNIRSTFIMGSIGLMFFQSLSWVVIRWTFQPLSWVLSIFAFSNHKINVLPTVAWINYKIKVLPILSWCSFKIPIAVAQW